MIDVRIDDRQVRKFLRKLTPETEVQLAKGMIRAAALVTGEIRDVIRSTMPGGTGALARSFRETFERRGNTYTAVSGSDLVYAAIQDKGGIIVPRTRQMLAIPLVKMARGKWPRHFPAGYLHRRGSALGRSSGRSFKALFALKPSVKIRPKNYLEQAKIKGLPLAVAEIKRTLAIIVARSAR